MQQLSFKMLNERSVESMQLNLKGVCLKKHFEEGEFSVLAEML